MKQVVVMGLLHSKNVGGFIEIKAGVQMEQFVNNMRLDASVDSEVLLIDETKNAAV